MEKYKENLSWWETVFVEDLKIRDILQMETVQYREGENCLTIEKGRGITLGGGPVNWMREFVDREQVGRPIKVWWDVLARLRSSYEYMKKER